MFIISFLAERQTWLRYVRLWEGTLLWQRNITFGFLIFDELLSSFAAAWQCLRFVVILVIYCHLFYVLFLWC